MDRQFKTDRYDKFLLQSNFFLICKFQVVSLFYLKCFSLLIIIVFLLYNNYRVPGNCLQGSLKGEKFAACNQNLEWLQ